ncbi:MAG: C4-type zinc ribbon domain-containing protein [Actinomycetota bacterium]|nr:C4-type zinc ribbon domain-containing protein [Actinomycetota bacterium]
MKVPASEQSTLLQVQDCDTRLAQLQHKSNTLPQKAELATATERAERLRKELIAAQTIVSDLEREQAKADADVDLVRERSRKDRELLDSGSINDPKQLQSLESELESLAKRQLDLEDIELEVMERLEGAQAAVTHLESESASAQSEVQRLTAEVGDQEAEIAAERTSVEADRGALVGGISAELLALYDKIRADHAGRGAARLHRGRCDGCRIDLPPTEVASLKAAAEDEVLRCEECRCILVRTDESGL